MTARSLVELTKAREDLNPSSFFVDSSLACRELGIDVQDIYGDFTASSTTSWLRRFEHEVAEYLDKEDALFLPSGVMAQNIVLAARKPSGVTFLCHHTSHLLIHEKDAYAQLLNMTPLVVAPEPGQRIQQPLGYAQVSSLLDSSPRPAVMIVELPHREIGGKCTSWEDLVLMSQHCRRNGIHFHCDGARLWEAGAAYDKPLSEIAALFDTLYVSFYKGLGAVTGAMLLGNTQFIEESRVWLRRFGGNVFSLLPYAVSCWSGFRANKDSFYIRKQKLVEVVARLTDLFILPTDQSASSDLRGLLRFDPPVPEVSLIHLYLNVDSATAMAANAVAAERTGVKCLTRMRPVPGSEANMCYTEFNMGPLNMQIDIEQWVTGWTALLTELRTAKPV